MVAPNQQHIKGYNGSVKSGSKNLRKSQYMLLGYKKVEDILQNYNSNKDSQQRLHMSVRIPADTTNSDYPLQVSMETGGDTVAGGVGT